MRIRHISLEFVGVRVAEIKKKNSNVQDWCWIPTHANPADLGTRANVSPKDLGPDSTYQNGMDWMCQPHSQWPCRKDFTKPPQEEMRKRYTCSATNAIAPFLSRFRSLQPAVRAMATVIAA